MVSLSGTPVLTTERLILRAPQADDWEGFRDFLMSERSRFTRSGDLTPNLIGRGFGHFIGHWVMRGFGSFVFCDRASGRGLGMCGPWFPVGWPEKELGWSVWTAEAEGKGLVFEAAIAARDHAFRDLGWETAVSYIDPGNTRSIALAERLGAVLDSGAATVDPKEPSLVYRHPRPAPVTA